MNKSAKGFVLLNLYLLLSSILVAARLACRCLFIEAKYNQKQFKEQKDR